MHWCALFATTNASALSDWRALHTTPAPTTHNPDAAALGESEA